MLTIFRRHQKNCEHREAGRKYRRCRCPIWVDGFLNGVEIRKSLELRDWEKAQLTIREWEAVGTDTGQRQQSVPIEQACEQFLADAEARRLRESTLKKYRVLLNQLRAFAGDRGCRFMEQLDLQPLRQFRESWHDGGVSARKKLERLHAFYRFAHDNGWVKENFAKRLRPPQVHEPPTLPFTRDEMVDILAACDMYSGDGRRLRAFVVFMRYSGMRIGDTATCALDRLHGRKLLLYTQKTNVPVYVVLPEVVVEALNAVAPLGKDHFFWTGGSSKETAAGNWRRSLRKLFKLAGVAGGHPHRFRDTFAVELLLAGVPLEQVSVLLGHSSIRVTEKHYAPWVRDRQAQLEASLERTWAQDPIILAETKGTPEVHGKSAVVN
jgi:integrase/recombinase XerD